MADTQLAPTDAELTAIYRAANGEDTGKAQPLTTQRIFRAMRAAIAKWGQPAHSGEPVAYCQPDDPSSGSAFSWPGSERNTAHNKPLFTAPQPVEREPLTDAQIKGLIEAGVFFGNCKEIVRAIEAAHGIGIKKGGQHGTE